jgi:hypothetical protein
MVIDLGMMVISGPLVGVREGLDLDHRSGEITDPSHPSEDIVQSKLQSQRRCTLKEGL